MVNEPLTSALTMHQTLCPYALRPLSSADSNDEHILPMALGAPQSFTVRALLAENSLMNDQIDSPTVNDPIMRLVAMTQGVQSRSGHIKATFEGSVEGSEVKVKSTLSQTHGLELRPVKPVETDQHGQVKGVIGFGDDAEKLAKRIVSDYARKGVLLEAAPPIGSQPTIGSELVGDMSMIRRQMFKIAYLMTVKVFGDEAITSPGGALLRAAMMAKDDEELKLVGISGSAFQPLPRGIARSSGHAEHALTCVLMPNIGVVSAVSLFDAFMLHAVVPSTGITAEETTGEVVYIDASTSSAKISSYMDALPRILGQSS